MSCMCCYFCIFLLEWWLQIGTGYLTPNNPNSVATIVQYGFSADKLEFTATGHAEVGSPTTSCC